MRSSRLTLVVFVPGVAAVLGALAWLTAHALRLEQGELAARREAKYQESIRLVLWRMDSGVTPIIAREAARPYFQYQPFYPADRAYSDMLDDGRRVGRDAESGRETPLVPSPLLRNDQPFVRLHYQDECSPTLRAGESKERFDATHGESLVSPQVPDGKLLTFAEPTFVTSYGVAEAQQRLAALRSVYRVGDPGEAAGVPGVPVPERGQTSVPVIAEKDQAVPRAPSPAPAPPAQTFGQGVQQQKAEETQSANEYVARQQQVANIARPMRSEPAAKTASIAAPASTPAPPPEAKQASVETPKAKQDGASGVFDTRQDPAAERAGSTDGLLRDKKALAARERAIPDAPSDKDDSREMPGGGTPGEVRQGEFAARWLVPPSGGDPELVFERTVVVGGRTLTQGFWIDWPALRGSLIDSARGLLPNADLRPLIGGVEHLPPSVLGRTLAAIPAELVVPEVGAPAMPAWSPVRTTLLTTWVLALSAVVTIGLVLRAAIDLAERRGQFVTAVTHELRTPLTTFVLYSQMLADGIIREEESRRTYITTLKNESQRLARIVESVLDFARLGKHRPSTVRATRTAEQVVADLSPVLATRCTQSGMELVVEPEGDLSFRVTTDPATLERIMYNLVDNACKYAAGADDRRVHLTAQAAGRDLILGVRDHGPGVPDSERRSVFRPFTRGTQQGDGSIPGLGLGLALANGLARELGGDLRLVSKGPGAEFWVRLPGA